MSGPRALSFVGLAVLLAGMAMVSPFTIDTFFPSFRAISTEFDLSALEVQQTLTAYMLPYALMSLFHGALSDVYGRRPVALWGMCLFTLASLACVLAPNFTALLCFRALQGMTAGAGFAVSRAVVRDLYEGAQAQRLLALITMLFGVAPALAPVIGGVIHVYLGWRAVFGFLLLFGVALSIAIYLRLPETLPPARRVPLSFPGLARTAWQIGSNPKFFVLALATGLNFAAVLAYVGAAPAVVQDHWSLTETQYFWLFLPVISGFVLGAFFSGRLAGRMHPARQVATGYVVTTACTAVLAAADAWLAPVPILAQQLLLFGSAVGAQLITPVITLRLLDMYPGNRGSVSSVQSFIQLMLSTTMVGVVVPLTQHSLTTLALASFCAAFAAWLLWRFYRLRMSPASIPT